jgi:DNA-binding transcriptional regulator of glucitol operon
VEVGVVGGVLGDETTAELVGGGVEGSWSPLLVQAAAQTATAASVTQRKRTRRVCHANPAAVAAVHSRGRTVVSVRRYRFALRPGWVVGHLLVAAAVVTMILLGRWQLIVSDEKHFNLQNFGYAIQWWAFSLFALVFWARILRDSATRRDPGPEAEAETASQEERPVPYRRYVMPTTPEPATDPVLAAYNDYLAELAEQDDEKR